MNTELFMTLALAAIAWVAFVIWVINPILEAMDAFMDEVIGPLIKLVIIESLKANGFILRPQVAYQTRCHSSDDW